MKVRSEERKKDGVGNIGIYLEHCSCAHVRRALHSLLSAHTLHTLFTGVCGMWYVVCSVSAKAPSFIGESFNALIEWVETTDEDRTAI